MVTVAHTVEELVRQKPMLHEALRRGLINHAALAEHLMPDVAKIVRKDVTFSAVNMAIRRLAEKLERRSVERVLFNKDSDISIRSHLVEITMHKTIDVHKRIGSLYDLIALEAGDFLTITQGLNEIMFITNEKHAASIRRIFDEKDVKHTITDLASITVHIPVETVETVGFFYIVSRALNWENINIVDVVSTLTELTFLIKEEDTGRAFDVVKKLIEKNS